MLYSNFRYPQGLSIDNCSLCNCNCQMCMVQTFNKKKGIMSLFCFEKLKEIFPKLKWISFGQNGEPLLDNTLIEKVQIVKKYAPNIQIHINTNGILLSNEKISLLVNAGINHFHISFDGCSEGVYEFIRIRSKYKTVLNNIIRLQEFIDTYAVKKSNIEICFVLQKKNISELLGVIKMFSKIGIRYFKINNMFTGIEKKYEQTIFNISKTAKDIFEQAKRLANVYNVNIKFPHLTLKNNVGCKPSSAVISPNGEVHPCFVAALSMPQIYKNKKTFLRKISFGNILKQSFIYIWESKEYSKFRERVRDWYDPPKICKICYLRRGIICPID